MRGCPRTQPPPTVGVPIEGPALLEASPKAQALSSAPLVLFFLAFVPLPLAPLQACTLAIANALAATSCSALHFARFRGGLPMVAGAAMVFPRFQDLVVVPCRLQTLSP